MDSFSLDLSSLIIHLEYQKKRIGENEATKKRMCYCRSRILDRYTATLQKFLIRLSARTLKFYDDHNYAITTDMSDLKKWFFEEIYASVYKDRAVSNKMVLLFRLVQENLDQEFFEIIDQKYKDIILNHRISNEVDYEGVLTELYEEIRSWFELLVYNVLAVQLNCLNISDKIFEDFDVPKDRVCCGIQMEERCVDCIYSTHCRKCTSHDVAAKGENIRLVITNELISSPRWMNNIFDVVKLYHMKLDEVTMDFDFRMYDKNHKLYFSKELVQMIETATQIFGKITISNYEGVEFNLYETKVEPFLRGKKK